jgi:hypothetical protein
MVILLARSGRGDEFRGKGTAETPLRAWFGRRTISGQKVSHNI